MRTEKEMTQRRKDNQTYRKRYPEKTKAATFLSLAIHFGYVHKPDHCEKCDRVLPLKARYLDYKKPLEAKWYCNECHPTTFDKPKFNESTCRENAIRSNALNHG